MHWQHLAHGLTWDLPCSIRIVIHLWQTYLTVRTVLQDWVVSNFLAFSPKSFHDLCGILSWQGGKSTHWKQNGPWQAHCTIFPEDIFSCCNSCLPPIFCSVTKTIQPLSPLPWYKTGLWKNGLIIMDLFDGFHAAIGQECDRLSFMSYVCADGSYHDQVLWMRNTCMLLEMSKQDTAAHHYYRRSIDNHKSLSLQDKP
jgi:hypothetical protein